MHNNTNTVYSKCYQVFLRVKCGEYIVKIDTGNVCNDESYLQVKH